MRIPVSLSARHRTHLLRQQPLYNLLRKLAMKTELWQWIQCICSLMRSIPFSKGGGEGPPGEETPRGREN